MSKFDKFAQERTWEQLGCLLVINCIFLVGAVVL